MKSERTAKIHVLEFTCQAPLKFYEHCRACPRFGDDCPDLKLGIEILRDKKKIVYNQDQSGNGIHASSFNCLTPLYYFEHSRAKCAHEGRCREEGLLLALLRGKKELVSSQKAAVEISPLRIRGITPEVREVALAEASE